jgi:quinol monooxygenase YgiN
VGEYIQIVEYQADDIDAVIEAANSVPVPDDVPKPISVTVVRDRDRPGTYASILRFESYEAAMRHSESDATHERIAKLDPLMKGDRRFYNLDVIDEPSM